MAPKAKKQVMFDITSVEHFQEIAGEVDKHQLAVIDLYADWCGSTICMEANFTTMYFSIESADTRIKFWRCSENCCPEDVIAALQHGPLTCRPRFLFYVDGEKKDEVHMADFTKIEQAINKFIPGLDD